LQYSLEAKHNNALDQPPCRICHGACSRNRRARYLAQVSLNVRRQIEMIVFRNFVAGTVCGIAFFFALVYSVRVVSAVTYPDWVLSIAAENSNLAFALWSLVTSVPLVVMISLILGFALSRSIRSHYFAVACLAVAVTLMLGVIGSSGDLGFVPAIRHTLLPTRWLDLPLHVAIYIALPIASLLIGRRSNAV
jgi:hypothetical protein